MNLFIKEFSIVEKLENLFIIIENNIYEYIYKINWMGKLIKYYNSLSNILNLESSKIGTINHLEKEYPLFIFETNNSLPKIFLSGGVHGDEPSGVLSLIKFMEEHIHNYQNVFDFVILPCLNPYGYANNKRENFEGENLNRNFNTFHPPKEIRLIKDYLKKSNKKFVLSIDLHEDTNEVEEIKKNERGIYLYESSKSKNYIGPQIINDISNKFNIWKANKIYEDKNNKGVIFEEDIVEGKFFNESTLEGFLNKHYAINSLTTEMPYFWDIDKKIDAQNNIVLTSLNLVKENIYQKKIMNY